MGDQKVPEFSAGDTVIVKVKVKEGDRTRLQAYEGVVIAKRNRGINSSFTVRKVANGEKLLKEYSKPTVNKLIALKELDKVM